MVNKLKHCDICNADFSEYGNNPEPFPGEKCCNDCNDRFVIPVRMCLGRGYNEPNLINLLQTIAEIGSAMQQINRESKKAVKVIYEKPSTSNGGEPA